MQSASNLSQFLPELNARKAPEGTSKSGKASRVSIQTQTLLPQANSDLPALVIVPNSALVHQRASKSVSDHLAVASMNAGASLPLMIGGRSKCVVNVLEHEQVGAPAHQQQNQVLGTPSPLVAGPQNTAVRAEQRRQNMAHISVVRPVVNTTQQSIYNASSCSPMSYEPFGQTTVADQAHQKQMRNSKSSSLIDDWMVLEKDINSRNDASAILDELILSSKMNGLGPCEDQGLLTNWSNVRNNLPVSRAQEFIKSDQEIRQQILALRREEHELNRGIMKQHHFVVSKIEERKRYLQIIQSVWVQRDFKHAIEKMIDIYQQGLIFARDSKESTAKGASTLQQAKLQSLNASLVVDIISIIILRPKLWTLEVCQMLLPIVNHDLLKQTRREHEYYVEVGLKAVKLVLTHFSSILKSTFDSIKESNKLVGIDLSREDRINKCVACYKLLLESQMIITTTLANYKPVNMCENSTGQSCKLTALCHEVQTMCASLRSSISLDPNQVARRSHNER